LWLLWLALIVLLPFSWRRRRRTTYSSKGANTLFISTIIIIFFLLVLIYIILNFIWIPTQHCVTHIHIHRVSLDRGSWNWTTLFAYALDMEILSLLILQEIKWKLFFRDLPKSHKLYLSLSLSSGKKIREEKKHGWLLFRRAKLGKWKSKWFFFFFFFFKKKGRRIFKTCQSSQIRLGVAQLEKIILHGQMACSAYHLAIHAPYPYI